MPYGNFDDEYTFHLIYHDTRNHDPDLSINEFIFEKILSIPDVFGKEEEENDDIPYESLPSPTIQIQAGHFVFNKINITTTAMASVREKPVYGHKEDNYSGEYQHSIFRPPAHLS